MKLIRDRLFQAEGAVVFLAVSGLFCLGWALWIQLGKSSPRSVSGKEIGYVSFIDNDVRTRFDNEFSWLTGKLGQKLTEGSAIYAGEGSRATFKFNSGAQVDVDANTLVILTSGSDNELQLGYGSLRGFLQRGEVIRVRFGSKLALIKGVESRNSIFVRRVGDVLVAGSSEGAASIGFEDRSVQLIAGSEPLVLAPRSLPAVDPLLVPADIVPGERLDVTGVVRSDQIPRVLAARPHEGNVKGNGVDDASAEVPAVGVPLAPQYPSREENRVSFSPALKSKPNDPFKAFYFSLGAGINFLDFAQTGSEAKSLQYGSLRGPSYSARLGGRFRNRLGFEAEYAVHPGEIKSQTANVANSQFAWITTALEGRYALGRLGLRFGAQHHQLPYVQILNSSSVEVRDQQILFSSVGADYLWVWNKKWKPSVFMRYQVPMLQRESNGDQLKANAKFAFDGSIGTSYELTRSFDAGFFWYGQWQEYRYSMLNSASGALDSGDNRVFFTNLELRLEYRF